MHLALVMGDDVDPLEEHGLDRGLPRPQAQRIIRQRRVIGVEDQRRAAIGMSDQLRMIHASVSSLSSGRSELQLPGLVARKEERAFGPASLVTHRMPTRCDMPMTALSLEAGQESFAQQS